MIIVIHADGTEESSGVPEARDDHLVSPPEELQPWGDEAPGLAVVGD